MYNKFSRYEEEFAQWKRDGYPNTTEKTFEFISYLSDPDDDQKSKEGILWLHQWDAFLRVVYCKEILCQENIGKGGLLLNIVTGGGKTAIIAALIVWLKLAHNINKFVIICPNLIVKDRIEDDFVKGKVFKDRNLIPSNAGIKPSDFTLTTLGSNSGWSSLFSAEIVLGNIHQFYQSNKSGQSNISGLMNGPDFVIFNDEAHNSPADEWDSTLKTMSQKTFLRIDTTATPDRADGKTPDSDMIYEYSVADALADRLVKSPVVYQPDIKTVQLTYTDVNTGRTLSVEEINWDEVENKGLSATQWVTDDKPMRQQMSIALNRLAEYERRAKGRYQPVLFVIAVCKADAKKAHETLTKLFKVKSLLVIEDTSDEDRKKATVLGRGQKTKEPYKAVVSVLMLREGWDVPEVGVILLLRKFSSKVYGQQVIGRGLRRIRKPSIGSEEQQILAVVDHPKLEHKWLWDMFGSKVRNDVKIDQLFDETEDLPEPPPKQELVQPSNIIDVPEVDPNFVDDSDFDIGEFAKPHEPLKNWREIIDNFVYDFTSVEITGQELAGIIGTQLGKGGFTTFHSAPDQEDSISNPSLETTITDLQSLIKDSIRATAEELTIKSGYSTGLMSQLYYAMLEHIKVKFLNGLSVGLAEYDELDKVRKMLPKVFDNFQNVPGLVSGIIEYGD